MGVGGNGLSTLVLISVVREDGLFTDLQFCNSTLRFCDCHVNNKNYLGVIGEGDCVGVQRRQWKGKEDTGMK